MEMDLGSDGSLWVELAVFMALLAGAGYFSLAETALTGASRARMTALEANGDARAELVNRLREKKDSLIGALLLGNNFLNTLSSAYATAVMIKVFGEAGIAIATVGVTIGVLVFAEVMPKTLALMHPDRIALFLARSVAIVVAVFAPVTIMVSKVVRGVFHLLKVDSGAATAEAQEEELRGAISLFNTAEAGAMADREKGAMLRSILDLADVSVEAVMVHRKNVRMINSDWPMEKIVDEVLHSAYTRLPVWRGTPENIVGVLHVRLLLSELRACGGRVETLRLDKALMEPWFIPESTTLFDQLQAFRARREHFAAIVDEYGAFMGIVTLEDILEEIVGQIDDEHDIAVSGVHPQDDGSYIVDGKVTIRDLNREFDWRLPDEDYATVAGLILFESQRIPGVGQKFSFHGFRFEVLKKQRNQIISVRVAPEAQGEMAQAAG